LVFPLPPVTAAVNVWVPPYINAADDGDTETEIGGGAVTVTVAVPDSFGSSTLVAVIVYVPATFGAVYVAALPLAAMVPPSAVHVTLVFPSPPVTVAVNVRVPP
jgi:hypothetical protein